MKETTLRLARELLKNGIRYQYLKWTGKPGKPQAVSLEITHNCIARCIMCNIWKIPSRVENLPVSDWLGLLSSELFQDLRELDITGGEPFLRGDLPELFSGIRELKRCHLKALRSVAVTTNGFLTERILTYTERMVRDLESEHLGLVMVCAMDAVGKIHDQIRNYERAWEKVNETIEGLIRLRRKFPNLVIGLKTTILPVNTKELDGIARYADERELFTIISPCIITEGRYLNTDRAQDLVFSKADLEDMLRFYRSEAFRWSLHRRLLIEYLTRGTVRKPCSCGFNYLFVRSNGEVFPCPLIDVGLGNIKEFGVEALFSSEKARRFRRRVGRFPECRHCTEPGLERYALPYQGLAYLSLLLKMGRDRFLQLHHHMGLDKYLGSARPY